MAGWLIFVAGFLVGWVKFLVGWLVGWLVGCLAKVFGWLASFWLAGCSGSQLDMADAGEVGSAWPQPPIFWQAYTEEARAEVETRGPDDAAGQADDASGGKIWELSPKEQLRPPPVPTNGVVSAFGVLTKAPLHTADISATNKIGGEVMPAKVIQQHLRDHTDAIMQSFRNILSSRFKEYADTDGGNISGTNGNGPTDAQHALSQLHQRDEAMVSHATRIRGELHAIAALLAAYHPIEARARLADMLKKQLADREAVANRLEGAVKEARALLNSISNGNS